MSSPRLRRLASVLIAPLFTAAVLAQRDAPAPRTPWGDPDLQGDYTNKYEQGTPFERPAEFAGRRLDDIRGPELTALIRERAAEVLLNAPFTGGDPVAGNFGGAPAFYDRFEASRGSRPWFVVDPPDGKVPPMTAAGQQAAAARTAARAAARRGRGASDSFTDRSLYDRCITRGLPGSMMPTNYGNSYRIVQSPGYVAITYEMVHETRLIPLDGRPGLPSTFRHYMGEPRGRWEGETLVVETTNFRDEPNYRNANPATLRFVERFTRTGADTVEWSVTVDDPATWTRPWTFAMPLTRNAREAVFEYACHEGNLAMANVLSAARAEEGRPGIREQASAGAPGPAVSDRARPEASRSSAPGSPLAGSGSTAPDPGAPLVGRWRTDRAAANFAGYATATVLVISEAADRITVQANTGTENQMQTAVYPLDGSEIGVPGPVGWNTTARAARQGAGLRIAITRTIDGPDGTLTFTITDLYTERNGVLTLERTQGPRTVRTEYRRD